MFLNATISNVKFAIYLAASGLILLQCCLQDGILFLVVNVVPNCFTSETKFHVI